MSIQKEIREALKESEGISLSNFHLATREQGKAHDKVRNNAPVWISHLLELIEQKDAEIAKLREIQRALVLTPMQKMSRAMEIIDKQKGADT